MNFLKLFQVVNLSRFTLVNLNRFKVVSLNRSEVVNFIGFCSFFDKGKLVILLNGFTKKTQKTPREEIAKAISLMKEYYEQKNKENGN